ncbi:MAG: glycerol-3-phosphate ABC transporter ATP-binding protein [Anaerolineaceae bacterium 4572_32.1]|nr:MAG: glycerol-3-phosphate ABC transporter ATP-binding protein [Anaerolineaceae bacterium 4572_32.1]
MASVKYEHVVKRWGDVVGINDLSIDIADKEFVVYVGPSGCGKSTALRLLAGLESITEGKIYIDDRVVNDVKSKDRDIAMVFQSYALYPHMSVYENMAFGLRQRKTPKSEIDKRVREAGDILGIEKLLDRKPGQLSGGQRQRVAIGRAIVREPNVFLMDEPLSNLDAKLRVQARAEISKLHQRLETTFIYVTHDQVEAMTMGTRIMVIKDGVKQQIDTPQNLYEYPNNLFVAGFIGSPAMNFMDAKLIERDGKMAVDCRDFVLDVPEDKAKAYRQYLGKDVILGIRPEDTHDAEYCPTGINKALVEVKVDVTELLGREVVTYLTSDNVQLVGIFDSRTRARVGNTVGVAFNMNSMHIFDKQTELAIR